MTKAKLIITPWDWDLWKLLVKFPVHMPLRMNFSHRQVIQTSFLTTEKVKYTSYTSQICLYSIIKHNSDCFTEDYRHDMICFYLKFCKSWNSSITKNKEAHEKCEILYSLYKEHKTLCIAWIDCQFNEIKKKK